MKELSNEGSRPQTEREMGGGDDEGRGQREGRNKVFVGAASWQRERFDSWAGVCVPRAQG